MRQIQYNSQRDNFNFANKFSGYKQCFSTAAWMFISYYNQNIDATNDDMLAMYVDDVEASVGKRGIGEKIKAKFSWITGKTSYWGLVQQAGIQKMLPSHNVIFDYKFPIDNLIEQVRKGPVIISTKKMGGLKGGHIILLVDVYDKKLPPWIKDSTMKFFEVNDPYGDALTYYYNADGITEYSFDFLKQYIDRNKNNTCIVIYAG